MHWFSWLTVLTLRYPLQIWNHVHFKQVHVILYLNVYSLEEKEVYLMLGVQGMCTCTCGGTVRSVLKVCGLNFFLWSFPVSLGNDLFALVLLCQSIVWKKNLQGCHHPIKIKIKTTHDSLAHVKCFPTHCTVYRFYIFVACSAGIFRVFTNYSGVNSRSSRSAAMLVKKKLLA